MKDEAKPHEYEWEKEDAVDDWLSDQAMFDGNKKVCLL